MIERRFVGVIQVRMNSSRVPGKALIRLGSRAVIQWVIDSLKESLALDAVIVATTDSIDDDALVDFLGDTIPVYRGSERNVAKRLFKAGESLQATDIVRITGDHPFTCSSIIDDLIRVHRINRNDYTSYNRNGIAEGVRSEIISMKSLEIIINGSGQEQSEYLTFFYQKNEQFFQNELLDAPSKYRIEGLRLMLDYPEDIEFLNRLIEVIKVDKNLLTYLDIVESLNKKWPYTLRRQNPKNAYEIKQKEIMSQIPKYE